METVRSPSADFRGRYRSLFDETSLSVEVIGIETESLLALATTLAIKFHQRTVLVKDYLADRIYLADKHLSSLADLVRIRKTSI